MKVKIISDSTCDLRRSWWSKIRHSYCSALCAVSDSTRKGDDLEVKPEDIYDFVSNTGKLPSTSAPNLGDFIDEFKKWRDEGYEIVHFNISSDFSSAYQNACTAASDMDGVYVVDTRNLSTGSGLVVLRGAELAQQGKSAAEIKLECEKMVGKVEASFVVDSIDYLHKGGRCSSVAALGANLLKLKPLIEVIDGKMKAGKKYRGNIDKVIINYVTDKLKGSRLHRQKAVPITHTKGNPIVVQQVRGKIGTSCAPALRRSSRLPRAAPLQATAAPERWESCS